MSDDDSRSSITPTASVDDSGSSPIVSPDDKQGVKDPAANDVLCGRGGSINSHPGNERFRTLVEKRKRVYLTARFKREKRLIASSIVSEIRTLNGRFLQRDSKSGLWKDIGDEKARDKTSQALRENAPTIRAEIEEEINEQRAELYKDEPSSSHIAASYPPPPTTSGYYNTASWYPSYYGYSSHPPPPHVNHPYPPPPPHSVYPPPPPHNYDYHYGNTHPEPPYLPQSFPKSTIEETADFIASGAESLKNWTKTSFSFSGGNSVADTTTSNSKSNKPIVYKHEDRRKMVKFRDESIGSKHRRVRPCYSPVQSNNSLGDFDMEPQSVDVATNATLMSQVANHILGSLGSWDGMGCGTDQSVYDEKVPFPKAQASAYTQDTERGVEWEGQEVQLVDESKRDEKRMPPPPPPAPRESHTGASIAFSSLGSCHSWFPEQVGAAASYFSGRDDNASMDMEYSGAGSVGYTAENYSVCESIGGGSLTKVFESEAMPSPTISHRELNQIPSWERSLRSKSPQSIGENDDDESLMSKCSSSRALSSVPSVGDEMTWTRE